MNFDGMTLAQIRDYAKSLGINVGNMGKEKLIAKINEVEKANATVTSIIEDDDLEEVIEDTTVDTTVVEHKDGMSLLDSITEAIDELEDSTEDEVIDEAVADLPMDAIVGVKSITYGGLTYKSRTTNAVFRWNQIGAVEYMTVAELNEMNNYKSDFLRRPLVILMDERAIKRFRLMPIYENVAKINNLTAVFNSSMPTIEKVIDDALKVNMRDVLISKVRQMYKNKKLVDINIIRLLEKKLSFDLDIVD